MSWKDVKNSAPESAEFIVNEAKKITAEMPARLAGSESENAAREYLAAQLAECTDEVGKEEFSFAPDAAMGWIYITVVCAILAFVAYFFVSFVSVVLIILALVPFFVQGIFCSRAFDGMYKPASSENLTAVKKCAGVMKRRIIFVAHTDASNEFAFHAKFGGKAFAAAMIISVVGAFYLLAADIARWAYLGSMGAGLAAGDYLIVGLVGLVFVPFWFACFFFVDKKKVVDGANDNLSGCLEAVALLKAMKDNGVQCENTEILVVLTSAEECGLRGAKAWCDAHREDFKDVPTDVLVLDTIRDEKHFKAGVRDLNGLVGLDAGLADEFIAAATESGADCLKGGVSFGATDAAAFAESGFRATSVIALDSSLPEYYHTQADTADNMNPELLAKCFKALAQFVENADGK